MESKRKHVLVISDIPEIVAPLQEALQDYELSFGLLASHDSAIDSPTFDVNDYDSFVKIFQLAIKQHGNIHQVISFFPNDSDPNSDRLAVSGLPLISVWITKLATFYFRQMHTSAMDKRLILVAPSPASCDNKSDPLSGMGSNSLLGLLRSLQHQAFFEGIRLSLVYSNDYTRQLGQSGTIQAIVQALTVDQPLTLETNGKIFLSDGRVISSTDTTMAGVLAYSKLGNRLVGLNALKSGIQSTFRKSIRFLDNSGIHKRHIQTGFTALASVAGLWLAWKSWFPSIVYVLFGFAFWRSLSSTKGKSTRKARNKSMNETCSTAVFLGSGGHTGEAIQLLSTLDPDRYTPRKYIFCTGDSMSLNKATVFEKDLRSRSTKGGTAGESHTPVKEPFQFIELPRARKVGQSYISSIGTTIYSLTITVWELTAKPIFTRQSGEIPDLLIVNGPGTCVVVVLAYKLLRMLGQPSPEVIYVESFARVTSLSLSGKILKNVVDRFIVQWPIETDAKPSGVEFSAANGKESHSNVEHHGWLI